MCACGNKPRLEHEAVKLTSYLETHLQRVVDVSKCELERHRSIHAALGAGIAVLETLKLVKSPIEIVFSITHL